MAGNKGLDGIPPGLLFRLRARPTALNDINHELEAMTEAEIRADERKRIAAMVADFSWILPIFGNPENPEERQKYARENEVSDDAACSVCEQISAAILAMT